MNISLNISLTYSIFHQSKLTSQVMTSGRIIKQILPTSKLRGKSCFLVSASPSLLTGAQTCKSEGSSSNHARGSRDRNCCCSVAQSCPTLCDPMACSTPGFSVLHHLLELAQTHVHLVSQWYYPIILSCVIPFSSCLQAFPASGAFLISWLFASDARVLELQLQDQPFQ